MTTYKSASLNLRNVHLCVSSIIITIIAFAYGLAPGKILPQLFAFEVGSIDLKQVFRATMCLYLSMVILWVIGIFKPAYWRAATMANVLFMFGLATGRLVSLVVDGMPSGLFLAGLALELVLGAWGIFNLKKYRVNEVQ